MKSLNISRLWYISQNRIKQVVYRSGYPPPRGPGPPMTPIPPPPRGWRGFELFRRPAAGLLFIISTCKHPVHSTYQPSQNLLNMINNFIEWNTTKLQAGCKWWQMRRNLKQRSTIQSTVYEPSEHTTQHTIIMLMFYSRFSANTIYSGIAGMDICWKQYSHYPKISAS